jgi:hypothetical protein
LAPAQAYFFGISIPSLNPVLVSPNAAIPPAPLDVALAVLVDALPVLPPPAPVLLPAPPAPPPPVVVVVADEDVSLPVDEVPVAVVVSPLEQAESGPEPIVSARSTARGFMGRDATTTRRNATLV